MHDESKSQLFDDYAGGFNIVIITASIIQGENDGCPVDLGISDFVLG